MAADSLVSPRAVTWQDQSGPDIIALKDAMAESPLEPDGRKGEMQDWALGLPSRY